MLRNIKHNFQSSTRKFLKRLNCSPIANHKHKTRRRLKNLSCYTDDGLEKMVKAWNAKNPTNIAPYNPVNAPMPELTPNARPRGKATTAAVIPPNMSCLI